jgi:hypothetical protein
MKYAILLAIAVGLAGCDPGDPMHAINLPIQPPQSHVTHDGVACVPIGYSFAPIWVDPRTQHTANVAIC